MTRLQRRKHKIVCKAQARAVFNSVSHDHNKEEGNGEETDCPGGRNLNHLVVFSNCVSMCLPFLVFFILFSKRVMFFFLKFYSQARISIKGRFLILMYSISQVYRILLDSTNIETYYIREQIISKMEQ